jgi:hypothetical protein
MAYRWAGSEGRRSVNEALQPRLYLEELYLEELSFAA